MSGPGALSRELVSYALARAGGTLRSEALGLVAMAAGTLPLDAADALADALEAGTQDPAERAQLLAELAEANVPSGHYVAARLLASAGRTGEAIESISRAIEALPTAPASLLAARARWALKARRPADAIRDLTRALATHPPYGFYVRVERMIDKLLEAPEFRPRRTVRVALLAGSTTALLAPVLRASLFGSGVGATLYEGQFGAYRQEILDPSSGLYAFRPDVVVLLVHRRALDLPPQGGEARAYEAVDELRGLWKALRDRHPCHVIQVGFETPPPGSWGSLEDTAPQGRRRVIAAANERLSRELPAGTSFLSLDGLAPESGLDSPPEWDASKQFPASAALPLFADAVAAHVRAALGLSSKVLALDLDNTLWGGVIGEDGLGGIRLGPPSAEGEAYQALQRYARELKDRGVLLAVCSKNNRADAESPFRQHDGMVLRLEDFVGFRANWDDKATNLKALAAELSLGLDSFVFLDDNPFERSWVRGVLPEVAIPEGGSSPWELLASLQRGMYFESFALTAEDVDRHRSYQASAALRSIESAGGSLEDFLQGLNMTARVEPVDATSLERVTQLVNKTNQFNVTTRRFTTAEVESMAGSDRWWCRSFRLADRFGDHGLIGVVFARIEGDQWSIDTWLMSCRVLGRRMEDFMARTALVAAREHGASRVLGEYLPTAKNGLVKDLFERVGFARTGDENRFCFDLAAGVLPTAPWIREVD